MTKKEKGKKFLTDIDQYKQKQQQYFFSYDENDQKTFYTNLGSPLGGIWSLTFMIICLIYLVNSFLGLYNPKNDTITMKSINNDFQGENGVIKLKSDFPFLHQLNIDSDFDIWFDKDLLDFTDEKKYIDMEKLQQYVVPFLEYQVWGEDTTDPNWSHKYRANYTNCNHEMYALQGYYQDNVAGGVGMQGIEGICPYHDGIYDQFHLKGDFAGKIVPESEYINFGIRQCDPKLDIVCKSELQIKAFLDTAVFITYLMEGVAELGDINNYGSTPVTPYVSFNSEFSLNPDQFRAKNNFMRMNKVETQDNRWNFLASKKQFKFLELIKDESHIEAGWTSDDSVTYVDGDYHDVETIRLYGEYYYLDHKIIEHTRTVETIVQLITNIGGFATSIMFVFSIVGVSLNQRAIINKFVQSLYFKHKDCYEEGQDLDQKWEKHSKQIDDDKQYTMNKIDNIQFSASLKSVVSKNKPITYRQKLLQLGEEKFYKEMNTVTMYQTIQKLKASISVIVDQNGSLQSKIQEQYFENNTLFVDEHEQEIQDKNKTSMTRFFESDERQILEKSDQIQSGMKKRLSNYMQRPSNKDIHVELSENPGQDTGRSTNELVKN